MGSSDWANAVKSPDLRTVFSSLAPEGKKWQRTDEQSFCIPEADQCVAPFCYPPPSYSSQNQRKERARYERQLCRVSWSELTWGGFKCKEGSNAYFLSHKASVSSPEDGRKWHKKIKNLPDKDVSQLVIQKNKKINERKHCRGETSWLVSAKTLRFYVCALHPPTSVLQRVAIAGMNKWKTTS